MHQLNKVLNDDNIRDDLLQGQSTIGGQISDNMVLSDKGTVMSYSVHGVEVMLINIKSNQELRVTRDIKAQQLFYPIMFS
ncbi:MAG: hypothetical protein ACRC3G_07100, partial [Bacteroidales bacterium]